jgi:hypothetical protein
MTQPRMKDASRCFACGRPLRNAVFCQLCGTSLCSWACYSAHVAGHALNGNASGQAHQVKDRWRQQTQSETRRQG